MFWNISCVKGVWVTFAKTAVAHLTVARNDWDLSLPVLTHYLLPDFGLVLDFTYQMSLERTHGDHKDTQNDHKETLNDHKKTAMRCKTDVKETQKDSQQLQKGVKQPWRVTKGCKKKKKTHKETQYNYKEGLNHQKVCVSCSFAEELVRPFACLCPGAHCLLILPCPEPLLTCKMSLKGTYYQPQRHSKWPQRNSKW